MLKRFCDACGDEMTVKNTPASGSTGTRVAGEVRWRRARIMVEVMSGAEGTMNEGDLCTGCIFDAVAELDKRPREVPAPS